MRRLPARDHRAPGTGQPVRDPARRGFALNEKTRFTLLLLAPSAILLILFQIVPIIIGANAAAFIFVIESVHTLVVNRLFLPRALRPAR